MEITGKINKIRKTDYYLPMDDNEYLVKRKALVSGQARKRSKMYPLLIGMFVLMIIVNVAMLAMNNMV